LHAGLSTTIRFRALPAEQHQWLARATARQVRKLGKVLRTGEAYELRDTDGTPISAAEGKAIVAERFSVPPEIRNARRRCRSAVTA
jgi:hypothetical protein